jgi:RHS repeat-associated protein
MSSTRGIPGRQRRRTTLQLSIRSFVTIAVELSLLLAPAQPALAAFGTGLPTVPNGNIFADSALPKVDGATGAFTQHIQLDIPPGRNGLQPDLALDYNSQNTTDNIVGYGWSLSIPYIKRLNKTGSQDLFNAAATSYFTSSIDGELSTDSAVTVTASSTPTIMDSLPVTTHVNAIGTGSTSFTYTVPSGGQHKLLLVYCACYAPNSGLSATLNGTPLAAFTRIDNGIIQPSNYSFSYLANPTSGTFVWNDANNGEDIFVVVTLQDAAQSNPIDAYQHATSASASSLSVATTTSTGNDLLLSIGGHIHSASITGYGSGETRVWPDTFNSPLNSEFGGSWKPAAAAHSSNESMTTNWSTTAGTDQEIIAVKFLAPISTSTNLRAKVDTGSHLSYSLANNTWTVYDKNGTRYLYGSDDSGRMYDTSTGTSTNTYKWMLQEIRDTNDNYIKYQYNRDNNELYPYKVTYTSNGSTDGIDTITFATSTRTDVRVSYAPTFAATTTKVISEVDGAVNGTTVRKYLLGFGTGNNGYRSMLTGVQQIGFDDNNVMTTQPTTTISYLSSNFQFYAPGPKQISNQAYVVADSNGDGINDINNFTALPNTDYVWFGNTTSTSTIPGSGVSTAEYWADASGNPIERGTRYIDINGDGMADFVRGWVDDFSSSSNFAIYLSTYATSTKVYTWSSTSTNFVGSVPTFAKRNSGNFILTGGLFGDINGDGLPDYVTSLPGTFATTTYLGNGSAWDATTTTFTAAKSFPTTAQTETASQLVDVNGDGVDDWVFSAGTSTYVLLNTGTGWNTTPNPSWTIATSTLYSSGGTFYDRGIRFMDLNGDGLPDFIRAYQNTGSCSGEVATVKEVMLNTGNGWAGATSTQYVLPAYITSCSAGSLINNEYENVNGNGQQLQDVLVAITYPKGGSLAVTYASSSAAVYSAGGLLPSIANPGMGFSLLLASTTVTSDGLGNRATTTYSYKNGELYTASGVRNRKFAGFAYTTATGPDSITTSYFGQGSFAQIGFPFRQDITDLSNNLMQRTLSRWDTVAHGDSTFVGLGRQTVETFGADGSHRDRDTDYQYSSTTDDIVKITDYGEVTANADGSITDIGTDLRTTNISYAASTSVNASLPSEKTLLDINGATTSDQRLYYDFLTLGQVNAGNNTKQEDWLSGTSYASSTKTFNSYGLVATSTDRNGNATSFVYDAYNLFVATTTNPLLQRTQAYYNYSNGKAKQTTDPNARLTRNLFDGLGRLTEVDQSSTSSPTTYATTTLYTYTDSTSSPSSIFRGDRLFAAITVNSYQYLDGLGRLIQERKASPTAGTYFAVDRIYNQAGELASTSLPYTSSGSAFSSPTSVSNLYTNYLYDPLQRVTRISNAIGTTTNVYYQWTKTTTDPDGNSKDYGSDAFGNLANVVEHGSSLATTTYTYDALNNLSTTTDALLNVRHFTYDGLSRRLTAQDLHSPGDTTFGTTTYTYDPQGNITSQTDAKGQVVNRTYDALNRMLTEDYTGQAGTEVRLTYDSCANGIGYLCTASSTGSFASSTYDILGRVATSSVTINNLSYAMAYSYDRQGNITALNYPDGSQVKVSFNLAGLPNKIQRKPSGGSFSDIISNYDYAPQSQIQNALFGNNASTTYFYDANSMYRLSNLQTTGANSTSIQKFAYTYDSVGNITQIASTASSTAAATTVFTYDTLNRLLSASTTAASSSPYTQSYTYDPLGNLLGMGVIQSATSSIASTSAPTILDTLTLTTHENALGNGSTSFTYNVPAGGVNKLLVVLCACYSPNGGLSATQNGISLANFTRIDDGNIQPSNYSFSYLANPTSGTFVWSDTNHGEDLFVVFTVQNASVVNPIDAYQHATSASTNSLSVSTTTKTGTDLLLSIGGHIHPSSVTGYGTGESAVWTDTYSATLNSEFGGAWKAASTSPATETMTTNWSTTNGTDQEIVAIKAATSQVITGPSNTYTYAGTGYANPDAVTQIANGLSTTTLTYDNDGNLAQKIVDGTPTTYLYDYANRLIAIGSQGATTTFGYDAFGVRVLQTGTSTTNLYPFKWYTVASSTGTGAKYATTTDFVFNGDSLVATIDQQTASGNATGTAKTRYIHPDHLGSTNVVTDENDQVVQTLDYYPYGSTRISSATSTNERRKYIGQFSDDSGLSYLNARYYDSSRGQFLSEDPLFLGDPMGQDLRNPQSLNSYSYANDNPITSKDPDGRAAGVDDATIGVLLAAVLAVSLLLATYSSNTSVQHSSAAVANGILNTAAHALNSVSQIVQTLPASHPLNQPFMLGPTVTAPLVNTGPAAAQPGVSVAPWAQQSVPWTSINLSDNQGAKGTPKPNDAPSGTKPIDQTGLSKDQVHQIKKIIDAGPRDWVGRAPNGDIITGTPGGETINHGPIEPYGH